MKTNTPRTLNLKYLVRSLIIFLILFIDAYIGSSKTIWPTSLIISVTSLVILFSWWLWKTLHKRGLPRSPISLPLVIYFLVVTLSTIFSVDQHRSLVGILATLALVLTYFLICDLLISGWKPEIFELALLLFTGLLLLTGLVEIIGWYINWYKISVHEYPPFLVRFRLGSDTWYSNLFAMLIYITLPFAIFRLYQARSKLIRSGWLIWLLGATIILLFLDSRGGLIATIIVLAITIGWLVYENGKPIKGKLREWIWENRFIFSTTLAYLGIFIALKVIVNLTSTYTGALKHGGGISAGRFTFWNLALDIFLKYPITGSGPSTYASLYFDEYPRGIIGYIAPHAHNLYLDTVAQMGILGLIVLVWIILAIPLLYYRSRSKKIIDIQSIAPNDRLLIVGTIAALVGFLIHSLFDVVNSTPHTLIPLFLLIALGQSKAKILQRGRCLNSRLIYLIISIVLIPLVLVLLFQQNFAQSEQVRSLNNGYEDSWDEAALQLDNAVRLDPGLSFYEEQRGYAYGVLSQTNNVDGNADTLGNAIESYLKATNNQPLWAPNYVNLAVLIEQSGNFDRALDILEAIPQKWLKTWPFSALLLANKYSSIGEFAKAEEILSIGFNQGYWVKNLLICQISDFCKEFANNEINRNQIDTLHEQALNNIEQGNPESALNLLMSVPIEESPPIIWIDRAAANIELNQFDRAKYELEVAEKLGAMDHQETQSYFALTMANFLIQDDKVSEAIGVMESVVKPRIRIYPYYLAIFQRIGFPDPLLPTLSMLNRTNYDMLIYDKLAKLYQISGHQLDATWARNQARALSKLLDRD